MSETELFPVPQGLDRSAHCDDTTYRAWYARSIEDPEGFWAEHGKRIDWIKSYSKVKDVSYQADDLHIRWFEDGTLNACANCVDRHLAERGDQVAIVWEGDDPAEDSTLTYRELHAAVSRFANGLLSLGAKKGDRITIYLPMIPEAAIAMLACARIGAVHSVVFGGFSPDSLAGRIQDCDSSLIITADEGLRGGRKVPLKANTDAALESCPSIRNCVVVKRTGGEIGWADGRDVWYHDLVEGASADCPPAEMAAEDPLFILYTSGSTGKPKGVLHTTGGYMVYASMTHRYVFDYHDGEIYWCTADVGWVTGHSYILYGPLANGATTLMFEGVPNYPDASRHWQVCDKHGVNIYYTAPTAIRALMREGEGPVQETSRASLRLLGSVGEPINPEAWLWYHRVVGDGRCPIVDTWWQTETGGILITPLPGATALKPGSATRPFFGVQPLIVDQEGNELSGACSGLLCLADSWPGQMRTVLRRPQALHRYLLLAVSGALLHRRRGAQGRGRLLLDHRPRGRRAQRLRPPHGDGGSGERVGGAPGGLGIGGGGLSARDQGPGHLRLRHAHRRPRAQRGAARRAQPLGAEGDRPHRDARPDPVGAGAAQDPLRQDHAPHPAQDRGQRARRAGRHLHPRRSCGGGRPGG